MTLLFSLQEMIWGAICLLWLWRDRAPTNAIRLFVLYLAASFCAHGIAFSEIWQDHLLAPGHILTMMAGKIVLIAAICRGICGEKVPRETALALTLQSAGVILGMYWAMDAPNWGNLWQWDDVETSALWMILAIAGWRKKTQHGSYWTWICLILLVLSDLMIYGGLGENASRHQYAQVHPVIMGYLGIWVAGTVFIAKNRNRTAALDFRSTSMGAILLCLAVWICLGKHTSPIILSIATAVLWCLYALHRRRLLPFCTGILLLILLQIPENPSQQTAVLEKNADWVLEGIHVTQDDSCYHYTAFIHHDRSTPIRFDVCDGRTISAGYGEIRSGLRFWRIWAMSYHAASGIELYVRDVTREKWLEIFFALIWLWIIGSLLRQGRQSSVPVPVLPMPPAETLLRRSTHRPHTTRESMP